MPGSTTSQLDQLIEFSVEYTSDYRLVVSDHFFKQTHYFKLDPEEALRLATLIQKAARLFTKGVTRPIVK